MTAKRDGSFPATSIGRVQGANIARTASFESLSAHPLLASSSSTPHPDQQHTPKYVPYTPRHHRVPSPFATTGTTLDSSTALSPQPHQGAATTKLQSMNSKAALQSMGLTTTSVGWAMLEKILNEPAHDAEWNDIWNTITTGKATLLLPSEDSTTHTITPEFTKDHIIFWDGSSRKDTQIITSSGLRGIITDDQITFRSSLYPLSRPFQDIQGTFSRSSALSALPPLTFPSGFPADFPTFALTSYNANLPLPPRIMASSKPSTVGRPSMRMPLNASSRLSNTFVSLFGKTPASTPPIDSPAAAPSDPELTVNISAFTIDRHIDVQDVGKEMNQAIKLELENSLTALPSRVREYVLEFAQDLCPLVKPSPEVSAAGHNTAPYAINMLQETPARASQRFQDFYEDIERRLTRDDDTSIENKQEHGNDYEYLSESVDHGSPVREALELVERTICSLFYDRLYLLSTSDDASHDETLSSRIAALNMLDLTLEHLDVHVGDSGHGLDLVVKSCGDLLTRLDSSVHSPAEKAALLVAAHKVVVEGLAELSSVELKSGPESQTPHDQTHEDENTSPASDVDDDSSQPPTLDVVSPTTPAKIVPISGDMLLPLIIFSVVKANPPHLVSHLLYIQRFRNKSVSGEESYCLINLLAVVEFLENVDLAALGLADSESKVLSAATLTPIQINRDSMILSSPQQEQGAQPGGGGLRGRVEQQVDAITGSAGKVISGVVDSFGMLRLLLPGHPGSEGGETTHASSTPWSYVPSQFGLLRREAGLSIASIAASLPGTGGARANSKTSHQSEEIGQPLVTVSRPSSVRNDGDAQDDGDDEEGQDEEGNDDGETTGDGQSSVDHREGGEHDSRSIRSFESMMSGKIRDRKNYSRRRSISDRLASVSGLGLGRVQNKDGEMGLKAPSPFARLGSPGSSRPGSPVSVLRIPPPSQRFLDMTEDDIKVSDVGELLREYKRVVAALRACGGFEE